MLLAELLLLLFSYGFQVTSCYYFGVIFRLQNITTIQTTAWRRGLFGAQECVYFLPNLKKQQFDEGSVIYL